MLQIYNHWGRVDDDISLSDKQVEDLLAMRPVFYDQHTQATSKTDGHRPTKSAAVTGADGSASQRGDDASGAAAGGFLRSERDEHGARVRSGAANAAAPQPAAASVRGPPARGAAAAAAGSRVDESAVRVTNTTLTAAEARRADREYNRDVLAAAGLAAMHAGGGGGEAAGGEEGEGGGEGGAGRGKKRGNTVQKLQKLMKKRRV